MEKHLGEPEGETLGLSLGDTEGEIEGETEGELVTGAGVFKRNSSKL